MRNIKRFCLLSRKGHEKFHNKTSQSEKFNRFHVLETQISPNFLLPHFPNVSTFEKEEGKNVIRPVSKLYDGKLTGFHDPLTPDEFSNSVNQKCLLLAVQTLSLGSKKFFVLIPSKQSQSSKLSALEK